MKGVSAMYPTKDDFYGFIFYDEFGDLSQSEVLSKKEISKLPQGTGNRDHLYIFCNRCDEYMEFEEGDEGELRGEWTCHVCGASVQEFEPYDVLNDANNAFEELLNDDDDDF